MSRVWFSLAVAFVLVGAVARAVTLAGVPRLDDDLAEVRATVAEWIETDQEESSELPESLRTLGVETIRFEVFDPEGLVYMQPGADGRPGVAGVDDNGNGIVDDNTELGATRTDDVLQVTSGEITFDGPVLILQRGAFVESSRDAALMGNQPWRAVVTGRSNTELWSFQVR